MSKCFRTTFTLTDEEAADFKKLGEDRHLRYKAPLLRNALRLLIFVARAKQEGAKLEIKYKDGSVQRLELII